MQTRDILKLNCTWAVWLSPVPIATAIMLPSLRWFEVPVATLVGAFLVAGIVGTRRPARAWSALIVQGACLAMVVALGGALMTAGLLEVLPRPQRMAWIPGLLTAGGWYAGYLIRRGRAERVRQGPMGFRFDLLFAAAALPMDFAGVWLFVVLLAGA